jgi:hypothetical protein
MMPIEDFLGLKPEDHGRFLVSHLDTGEACILCGGEGIEFHQDISQPTSHFFLCKDHAMEEDTPVDNDEDMSNSNQNQPTAGLGEGPKETPRVKGTYSVSDLPHDCQKTCIFKMKGDPKRCDKDAISLFVVDKPPKGEQQLPVCMQHKDRLEDIVKVDGLEKIKPRIELVDASKLVCNLPHLTTVERCDAKDCLSNAVCQFTNTECPEDSYFLCGEHSKHKQPGQSDATKTTRTGQVRSMPEVSFSPLEHDEHKKRLFQVSKGRKKEDHWEGIHLVADDQHIGTATKSEQAKCAYCDLCDTFFPYHHIKNSKSVAAHKTKWCTAVSEGTPPVRPTKTRATKKPTSVATKKGVTKKTAKLPMSSRNKDEALDCENKNEKKIQDLEVEIATLNRSNNDLKRQLESAEGMKDKLEKLAKRFKVSEDENKGLQNQLQLSKNELQHSEDEKKGLQEQLQQSEDAKKGLQEQLQQSEDAKKGLQEQLQQSEDEKKGLQDQLQQSEDEKKGLQDQLQQLQKEMKDNVELHTRDFKKQLKKATTDFEAAREEVSKKTSKIQQLEQELLNEQQFARQQQEHLQSLRNLLNQQTEERTSRRETRHESSRRHRGRRRHRHRSCSRSCSRSSSSGR